jgi:N-acetylglucosaminyl-diphospho-decaprenol L-rhamnosyltransferase
MPEPDSSVSHRSGSITPTERSEPASRPEQRLPRVGVVIVTFNSGRFLAKCLSSLPVALDGTELTAIVIADNASTDDTEQVARTVRPDVQLLPMGRNAGYAAAINAACVALPDGDFILVLNPDTVLRPGLVARLAEALEGPGRGIAVPRHVTTDGQGWFSLRREPTLLRAVGEAMLGGERAGRYALLGELVADPECYTHDGSVDWANGAVMLISGDCARAVGPWDESYLLYSEETDFMLRARDAGFATWFVHSVVAEHRGGDSGTTPFLWSLLMANRAVLYGRRHGRISAECYRIALLAGEAVRAAAGRQRSKAAVRLLARPGLRPAALPPAPTASHDADAPGIR